MIGLSRVVAGDGLGARDAAQAQAPGPGEVVGVDGLLGGALRSAFDRLVAGGTPAQASALYLSGWFPGGLAAEVGYRLAVTGAGFCVRADEVRWTLHPEGWPAHVALGAADRLVLASHPWAAADGVEVVSSPEELLRRTVDALAVASAPLVDACHRLTRVGRAGLWNEVGDGLGCAVSWDLDLPIDDAMLEVLAAAVRVPSAPWKARTDLRFAPASFGPVHVAQKGGCCLAYTEPDGHHCTACSRRSPEDCDAECVAWFESEHASKRGAP